MGPGSTYVTITIMNTRGAASLATIWGEHGGAHTLVADIGLLSTLCITCYKWPTNLIVLCTFVVSCSGKGFQDTEGHCFLESRFDALVRENLAVENIANAQ